MQTNPGNVVRGAFPSRIDKTLAWLMLSRDNWKEKCRQTKFLLKRKTFAAKRLEEGRNSWRLSSIQLKQGLYQTKKTVSALQQQIKNLESQIEIFKNENAELKKKVIACDVNFKPERHSYSLPEIELAMKWKQNASMRFRGISSAMSILFQEGKVNRVPSHEICVQWDLKIGFHKLNRPKHATSDWCWIIDQVIAQGSTKCLAIMGVRCDVLHQRNDWTLTFQDLEPFGLIPMHRSTGEEVSQALYDVTQRSGIVPRYILSDRGPDLLLGIKKFQKMTGCSVVVLYDICHKIAREYEKLFTDNSDWNEFKEKANYCKKQLQCTNGVSFAPPSQRKKARYLNVDIIIGWAMKMLQYNGPWDDKVYEKIKWVYSYEKQIKTWSQWVEVGKHFRDQLRISGFGADTKGLIIERISPLPMIESTQQLVCTLLDFVSEEASKLSVGERTPATTEVIESLFGYFKYVKNGLWDKNGGIGRLILTMASRVGELTSELIQNALNEVRQKDLFTWLKKDCYS